MTQPRLSMDDYNRDVRITNLERQVAILVGQVASRDAAITQLLKEVVAIQADTAVSFIEQYPQMLEEIDLRVRESLSRADEDDKVQS